MPSTTATQLASTRRKLRLAHHRRAAPSASANHEVSGSPAPSPTLTAGSSAGTPSPTSLSAAAGSTARPLAEPRGTPARGRSRRSRAVTRRGPEAVGESTTAAAADLRNPLNLPAAPSVDSDDNGTCFNSIGTTTPRQPSPRHAAPQRPINGEHHAGSRPYQPRLDDGDNSRTEASGRGRLVPAKTRGRRGGKDGTLSPLHEHGAPVPADSKVTKGSRGRAAGGSRRGESIWDHPEELVSHPNNNARSHRGVGAGGDNASAAYSEFDQDGNASYRSASVYSGKPTGGQRYPARGGRGGASLPAAGGCEFLPPATGETGEGGASVESSRYDEGTGFGNSLRAVRKSLGGEATNAATNGEEGGEEEEALLNRPHVKAALGVGAAATLGAIVLGPVGLLVGAASVGIGMGVMQIPEEQRTHVRHRASTSFAHAREVACDVSDQLNTGCARYTGTDPKEVMEKVVPEEILEHVDSCCHAVPEEGDHGTGRGRGRSAGGVDDGHSIVDAADVRSLEEGGSPLAHAARLVGDAFGEEPPQHPSSPTAAPSAMAGGGGDRAVIGATELPVATDGADGGRRAACGRPGRVVPLGQIHSLRPSLQPRAWLDVMASAHTGRDDKNEAMQEILILAKDKEISRWFLEEGILDSLMCILSGYFRNYSAFLRNEPPAAAAAAAAAEVPEPFASFQPGGPAFRHARLAANCCVALGKAHCAAVHTEGDLLLMSAYSRGSVPIERQLAQMLFEVPHHMKAPPPPGNGGEGPSAPPPQGEAEFTLTELSMQQAEDLASSIKALDDGKIDV